MTKGWFGRTEKRLQEREAQLEALAEAMAIAAAPRGQGSLVFVGGEAGAGKTSLVRHLAGGQEGPVLLGTCDPVETPRALGPLFDMAWALGADFSDRLTAATARTDLFVATVAGLAASGPPPLVVFEDVHWADQATLDLLRHLGRRVERVRALVVVTFREEEVPPGSPPANLLGDLATAPGVHRLSLPPLSPAAIRELAEGTGADPDDLHRRTGGNPFFVTEALAAGGGGVPLTVRDAVLARVARLSPAAQEALRAAAATGARLDPRLLALVLDATGTPRWGVQEAILGGLLVWQGTRLAFRHELAQAAVAEATPAERRQRLHAVILDLLRRRGDGDGDAAQLVLHAEAAGDDAAVAELAPRAAGHAARLSAHREAAALYAKALAADPDLPVAERARLLEAQAAQTYLAGRLAEAADRHRGAAALWHEAGDRLGEGRNLSRLSSLSFLAGRYPDVDPAADAAIACLEALPPSRELALAYDGRARLSFMAQDAGRAEAWAERARNVAERLDEPEMALEARATRAAARLQAGQEGAIEELEAVRAEASGRELRDLAARATLYLGWLPIVQHRYDGVERHLAEGHAYAVEHELGYWESLIAGARVRWSLDQGRWDEVVARAEAVLDAPDPVSISRLQALVALGRLRARRGEPDPRACLDQALAMLTRHPGSEAVAPVWPARVEAAWLAGDGERALAEAGRAITSSAATGDPWWSGELAFWTRAAGGAPGCEGPAAEPYRLANAGDWAAAAAWWEGRGCPYEAAVTLAGGDEREQVARAIGILDRLGARPAAALARRRLRELGATSVPRGPRPSTSANPAGLTGRELQVLELVAEGLTNADVAARLFLSEKTVERHLSGIFRKLDASTRTDAVAAARQAGALGSLR